MSEKKEVPGYVLRMKALWYTALAEGLGLVMFLGGAIRAGVLTYPAGRHEVPWASLVLAGAGALFTIVAIAVEIHWRQAFEYLAGTWKIDKRLGDDHWKSFQAEALERDHARKERDRHFAFFSVFPTPPGDVKNVLGVAALSVREACEAEDELHIKGIGKLENHAFGDPEIAADHAKQRFNDAASERQRAVKVAKDEFLRLWQLAKDHGYDLKGSWQPYAGLDWKDPSEQR